MKGRIIYIRRSDERGQAVVLGRQYEVRDNWCYRLVRCEAGLPQFNGQFNGITPNFIEVKKNEKSDILSSFSSLLL